MQKQPASDSGLPAQVDGTGTPAKPSTVQTPKPSAFRPGQAKPKSLTKPDAMAKPQPAPKAPAQGPQTTTTPDASGSEGTTKSRETLPAGPAAKSKPPHASPAKGKPTAPTMNPGSGKPAAKPVGSPAEFAKPKQQTAVKPKPAAPAAAGGKPKPDSKNLAQPPGSTTPANADTTDMRQKTTPTGPKPGPKPETSRPAANAQATGTPVAQPRPVKPLGSLAKPVAVRPASPKRSLAGKGEPKQPQNAKTAPQAQNTEAKAHGAVSGVATPSEPIAAPASEEPAKPTHLNQSVENAVQKGKPAKTTPLRISSQPRIDVAQDEAAQEQSPGSLVGQTRPGVDLREPGAADSSTSPRTEALDSRTDENEADPALPTPDGAESAVIGGSEPSVAPAADPARQSGTAEPVVPATATAQNASAPTSSGLMGLLLVLSFVLEVALLGAVAFGAMWALPQLSPIVAILVTVVPLMILWGLFMSPKASFRISSVMHAILAHALFVGGAVLLFLAGQPMLAISMGVLTLLSLVLTLILGGQGAVTDAVAARKAQATGSSGSGRGKGRRAAR